ncbi:MAG: LytR family transcriptional regulator [Candidatus Neomarinimicrobiota bacterium]|nr:MAG: LytR family transcriptional regulator [Candidatus Neomarinimicrobiota bacterium]
MSLRDGGRMAARRRRKKSTRFWSRLSSGKRKKNRWQNTVLNGIIAVFSIFVLVFIYSFAQKAEPGKVEVPSLNPSPPRLAAEAYEANPILEYDVEVLNGCGERGVAAKMSEFLRKHRIDVVRAENAPSFDYTRTQVISRNENVDALETVVRSLGFDMRDRSRVLVVPDAEADVDVTVIVGKDYRSIPAVAEYLNSIF